MPVKIHNKEYTTVAERISQCKEDHPEWRLLSRILRNDNDVVVIKAFIKDQDGNLIGIGHAEEVRGSTNINRTSALENCETSAWGRALASCGYGGEQVASANEVTNAIINQEIINATDSLIKHNNAVREHISSILAVKEFLRAENFSAAVEAFHEIPEEDRMSLNIATTKGGIWSIDDVKCIRDARWSEESKLYKKEKK